MLILTIVCFAACMLSIARIRFTVSTTDVSEEIYAGKVAFFCNPIGNFDLVGGGGGQTLE